MAGEANARIMEVVVRMRNFFIVFPFGVIAKLAVHFHRDHLVIGVSMNTVLALWG
jgi:hypothetical protein